MTNLFKLAALALPAALAGAHPAMAGTITDVEVPYYQGVTLSGGVLEQDTGSSTMDVGIAGQIILTTDTGKLGVWCVDLLHDIYLGGHYTFTDVPLTSNNVGGVNNQLLTSSQVATIEELSALGDAVLLSYSPVALTPTTAADLSADLATFKAANGTAYSAFINDLPAFSAAIQSSIWDVEYGTTVSSTSADFNTDMPLINAGAKYFANIGGYELDIAGGQDQFLTQVPEPSSLALVGMGLFGLGAVSARRRGRSTTGK